MKVSNIKDIDKFFAVVDSCEGRVELVTGEGDRLNLKSKLSQYVSLANIFSGGEIPELEIVAYENWSKGTNFGFLTPPGVLRDGARSLELNPKSKFLLFYSLLYLSY